MSGAAASNAAIRTGLEALLGAIPGDTGNPDASDNDNDATIRRPCGGGGSEASAEHDSEAVAPRIGHYGVTVYGNMPGASAERKVSYSFSNTPKRDDSWHAVTSWFGDPVNDPLEKFRASFLGKICNHEAVSDISHKDKGFAWAPGVISGSRRTDDAVTKVDGLMAFDFDKLTEQAVIRLQNYIASLGVTAVVVSSISHMLPYTSVPVKALKTFADESGLELGEANLAEVGRKYLTAKKADKYFPETLASIERAEIVTTGRDTPEVDIYHAPQARYRLIILEKDARNFDVLNPAKGEADHRQLYVDMLEMFRAAGFEPDRTCSNRGRMFYGSRHVEGVPYEVIVFCGNGPADMSRVPQTEAGRAAAEAVLAGKGGSGKASNDRSTGFGDYKFQNGWVPDFIRNHANDFQAAAWYEVHFPDDVRTGLGTDKVTGSCGWEDLHTPSKSGPDTGFIVTNPGYLGDGFNFICRHETCSRPEHSNGDRARHLDKIIADHNAAVTSEAEKITENTLLEFCPAYQSAQKEKEQTKADAASEFESLLAEIKDMKIVDGETIARACDLIVAKHPGNRTGQDGDAIRLAKEAAGWERAAINRAMTAARVRATKAAGEAKADARTFIRPPQPGQNAETEVLSEAWDPNLLCEAAKARWEKLNHDKPTVFRLANGNIVRVADNTKAGARFVKYEGPAFGNMLRADFIRRDGISFVNEAGNPVLPPATVQQYMNGCSADDLDLPEIDRIEHAPVFVPGIDRVPELLTVPGYHAGSRLFYAPYDEFLTVPDVVTWADVQDAVKTAIPGPKRDFPVSDNFEGVDPLPVRRVDENGNYVDLDDEGFPLPNPERGQGSYANAVAMDIQAFIRPCIKGSCPNYHIDKPQVGTGAGYLVDVHASITSGDDRAKVRTFSHDKSEVKKALTSALLSSGSYIFLDNVQTAVDNPDIAAMITAGTWTDRVLGSTSEVEIPITKTLIMAGNSVPFNEDMLRRNVPIYMNAGVADAASDRPIEFFKHRDLHAYTAENRAKLVRAYHVLIRWWVQQGCPRAKISFPSFQDYAEKVGGILEAAGIKGFLSNRLAYMAARRPVEVSTATVVTERVWDAVGSAERTPTDLVGLLASSSLEAAQWLRSADNTPLELDPELGLKIEARTRKGQITALGMLLRKWTAAIRVGDGDAVQTVAWRYRQDKGGSYWRLEKVK